MSTILVVDDDLNTREGVARALRGDYRVLTAADAEQAVAALSSESVDLVLTDLRMPGRDGLSLLRDVIAGWPSVPVILLSAYGSVESAVEAMKGGAFDFLTKPINLDHLELVIKRTLRQKNLERQNAALRSRLAGRTAMERMIGESPALAQVRERIEQAAPTPATVLIQGPSGTGKELVARAIHALSPRADKPFVAVHCAALSSSLLESELFGHVKGAFTGADEDRKGRFELADGGTLFLDEISEIEPSVQVKLLRVLETRMVEPVGSAVPIPVDIRLVAATNRDLRAWVDAGKFREDLYFRLNVVDINLPPLSARQGDIPLLCNAFIQEFNPQLGKQILGMTPELAEALGAYAWPGNVRELRNTVEKMMVLTHSDRLTLDDLPPAIRQASLPAAPETASPRPSAPGPADPPKTAHAVAPDLDAESLRRVLAECRHNRTAAAKALGISVRTLYRRLKEFGLE